MDLPVDPVQYRYDVWLNNVKMLVVPAAVMGFILVVYICAPKGAKSSRSKKPVAPDKSSQKEDVPKLARLDTHGLILSPWRISSLTLDTGDSSGWFNLAYLVTLFWFVSSLVSNVFRTGGESVFLDRGFFVVSAFKRSHELAVALGLLYGLFSLAYVLQLVAMSKLVPYSVIIVIQAVLEGVLFLSALAYSTSDDAVERWPFSQRLGLMLQSSVFILKMHSYLAVNRKLALAAEAAAAGMPQQAEASTATSQDVEGPGDSGPEDDDDESESDSDSSSAGRGGRARAGSRARLATRKRRTRSRAGGGRSRSSGSTADRRKLSRNGNSGEDQSESSSEDGSVPPAKAQAAVVSNPAGLDYIPAMPPMYPNNVTFLNFFNFSFMPTLVYLPTYAMTKRIRVFYCVEKSLLGLGLLLVAMTIVGHYVLPVFARMPYDQPIEAVANLIIPFICLLFCFFFIVFESILNFFAEVTRMADRTFYRDWWNATSYTAFSRDWNIPVSAWLRLHVYEELQLQGLHRETSRLITFGISIVLHELVAMGVVGVVSPWLALFSVLQFPLFSLMRSSFFKGKRLGNLVFWLGLVVGVPLIAVLYSQEYCAKHRDHCGKLKDELATWPLMASPAASAVVDGGQGSCECKCDAEAA